MSATKDNRPTVQELAESLTGYEEDEMARVGGADDFTELGATKFARALYYVLRTRTDTTVEWAHVMRLPMSEINAAFRQDDEEGKGA